MATRTIGSGQVGRSVPRLEGHAKTSIVNAVVFSPDARRIVSAGLDAVRVWDAETGIEQARYPVHESGCWAMSLSPDGRTVARCRRRQGTRRVALPRRLQFLVALSVGRDFGLLLLG